MAIPMELVSHTRKVCSLYKRALRNLESFYDRRPAFRYQAVLLRHRFDENRNVKDMREARVLLEEGERELFMKQHYQPKKFARSPGGVAYAREVEPPDWVLDYWHPLEKAQYPEYFARREQRKKQFIEWWEKQYGKPSQESSGHH
ncbi:NADH dehydrogenase [ubiquinone] 1 beta subcomplex subunit 9 [Schistocerca nitens]|uniref:NADH dehydrogenase [ubiquinone] 1 beta subcomplex subunit 9 n=1 Tax=Schistocerca nitens TaxID=7011 RepID=UPI002117E9C5|nr:NADH dehydrogenase [ubiquinone] 1 beta subcomplex subunit 9 [Schistocerca nitens]